MVVLFIFFAEMLVVTIGTLRIIFVSRGHKVLAPVLGFFEILIWLFAISQTMQNLDNIACFLAFALGFTLGNFFGILIEKKLAMGMVHIRIITQRDPEPLLSNLRRAHFGATLVRGQGSTGPVNIVLTVVKRKQMTLVKEIIQEYDPGVFYAVDELQTASAGIFPMTQASRDETSLRTIDTTDVDFGEAPRVQSAA